MATEIGEPGVFLTGRDCALVDRALREGLAVLAVRDGASPAGVEQVTAAILAAATEFRFRQQQQRRSAPGSGTARARQAPTARASAGNGWMSITEAAEGLDVSESYVRRLARQKRLTARRDGRGAWLVDASSVAAWAADRRETEAA